MSIERNLLYQELGALGLFVQSEVGFVQSRDFLIADDQLKALRSKYAPIMDAAYASKGNTYLTDIIFYGIHPELNRRKLTKSDAALIEEWTMYNKQHPRKNTTDYLTDVIFYDLHPDLMGYKLTQSTTYSGDAALIQEWKDIRAQIVLHYLGKEATNTISVDFSLMDSGNLLKLHEYLSKLRDFYTAVREYFSSFLDFQNRGARVIVRGRPLFDQYVDFSSQQVVMNTRTQATNLVFKRIIPLLIEALNIREAKKVIQTLLTFEQGAVINTLVDLLYYDIEFYALNDTKQKQAYRQKIIKLLETTAQIYLDSRKPSDIQTGVEAKGSKGENVRAKSNPDNPKYNLTGKFEYVNSVDNQQTTMGVVMSINQAGRWIEGVLSVVFNRSKVNYDTPKGYYRFYAEVLDWDKPINLIFISGNDKILGTSPKILIQNQNTIKLNIEDRSDLAFSKVANQPILTERHLVYFSDNSLVKSIHWTPILTAQKANIDAYFKNFKGYKPILSNPDYKNAISIANRNRNLKNFIIAIAKGQNSLRELEGSLYQFIEENFHDSDSPLASFYIRHYLNEQIFAKDDGWRLTLTSWLYRELSMYEKKYRAGSSAKEFIFRSPVGTKVTPLSDQLYQYKIEVKLFGLGVGFILKGGYYRGEMTISCKQWRDIGVAKDATLKISFFEFGGGLVESINLGQSFEGVAESDIMWMPSDFKGDYGVAKADAEVGMDIAKIRKKLGISAGISATLGVMEIDGTANLPPLRFGIYSLGGVIAGIEPEPHKTDKESNGFGFEATVSVGYGNIWKDGDFPAPQGVIRYGNEQTLLKKIYQESTQAHFKHDSALLTEGGSNLIRKMCANELFILMSSKTIVKIIAHTDRSGDDKYNLQLSENRALNVRQRMYDICGVNLKAYIDFRGEGEALAKKEGVRDGTIFPKYRHVDIEINGTIVLSLIGA
jgi:outer membrane protein OmpA-like peptidoglycan-associated protein